MTVMHEGASMSPPRPVSVVLVTYNEKENLSRLAPTIEDVFNENGVKGEIIVVDDNSPDGTADLARELGVRYGNVRLLWRPEKMGPGSAYADGCKAAKGEIIIGMDTDLSHDPYDIPRFLAKIDEGYDLVQASRYIKNGSYEVNSFETWRKRVVSRLGNLFIASISHVPVHDFTTSYRAMRREVVENVEAESPGNSYFVEFLIKAYRKGYRITEIPIVFKDRVVGKSKLRLGRQSLRMLIELTKL